MRNTAAVTGGKPSAVLLQYISGVSINPLVAVYDIHGGKRGAILLFCPGHHTRQQTCSCTQMFVLCKNRIRDLLHNRRVFGPQHQIRSQYQ
jgi:hypothetical protein